MLNNVSLLGRLTVTPELQYKYAPNADLFSGRHFILTF